MRPTGLGRDVPKLDPDLILLVYLGHSQNTRDRLQHYGRSGAHLATTNSTRNPNSPRNLPLQRLENTPGLFEGVFSRGGSIVFRWAPMQSKRDAEKTESRLLNKFDYAWNKGGNGARRPNEILCKLNLRTFPVPGV